MMKGWSSCPGCDLWSASFRALILFIDRKGIRLVKNLGKLSRGGFLVIEVESEN